MNVPVFVSFARDLKSWVFNVYRMSDLNTFLSSTLLCLPSFLVKVYSKLYTVSKEDTNFIDAKSLIYNLDISKSN